MLIMSTSEIVINNKDADNLKTNYVNAKCISNTSTRIVDGDIMHGTSTNKLSGAENEATHKDIQ